MFHLHRTNSVKDLPKYRPNPDQIWVWLSDESPFNTFLFNQSLPMAEFNGYFNWSMNYRMDADIPVPYGRFVAKKYNNNNKLRLKEKSKMAAILLSNANSKSHRWDILQELMKYPEDVHIFGRTQLTNQDLKVNN